MISPGLRTAYEVEMRELRMQLEASKEELQEARRQLADALEERIAVRDGRGSTKGVRETKHQPRTPGTRSADAEAGVGRRGTAAARAAVRRAQSICAWGVIWKLTCSPGLCPSIPLQLEELERALQQARADNKRLEQQVCQKDLWATVRANTLNHSGPRQN